MIERIGQKVLDHGHCYLVESMGSDLSIVRNARVSYDAEWRAGEDEGKDAKLINYLLKNNHTSPFEAVQFTFDIRCPIFVARQWHRHRTWAYNEVSARYAELPEEMYVPDVEVIGTQSSTNKQMRVLPSEWTHDALEKAVDIQKTIRVMNDSSYRAYKVLLEVGTPRELARGVLPLNIYTHFFGSVNLHNLFRFLKLRMHEHAQYEIRVYAEALFAIVGKICPVAADAFFHLHLEKK